MNEIISAATSRAESSRPEGLLKPSDWMTSIFFFGTVKLFIIIGFPQNILGMPYLIPRSIGKEAKGLSYPFPVFLYVLALVWPFWNLGIFEIHKNPGQNSTE